MSSDLALRRSFGCNGRAPATLLAALLLTLAPLTGCGKKGDPLPPPRAVPARIADLAVRQRGLEVVLEMGYPKTTVSGLVLPALAGLEVLQAVKPVPAESQPLAIDGREFAVAAKPMLALEGAELKGAVAGDRLTVRFRLTEPLPKPAEARYYAVRTRAERGAWSELSNVAGLAPRTPPAPPSPLTLTPRADGVEIAWGTVSGAAGYHVYRREAERVSYGAPLQAADASATSWVDKTARYGQRYIYTVCTLASKAPVVESAPAGERELVYEDRFPPEPPARVSALPSPGSVRLLWEASPSPDVSGYKVYRQDPGADFHLVTPAPIAAHELVDSGLGSGLSFRYRVTAVDPRGNEGLPALIETRVP